MRRGFFWLAAFLLSTLSNAQTTWRRTYGGLDADRLVDIRELSQGGYFAIGSTSSFGDGAGDMYAVRIDETGELLWSRTYGDLAVQVGEGCLALADGFALAGTSALGSNGGYDLRLIRTDLLGAVLWQKDYGTSDWDLCSDVEFVGDGFVIAGTTYGAGAGGGDAYLVRTNMSGDTLWTRTYGTAYEDEGMGVDVADDGVILLSGSVGGDGTLADAFVAAFTSQGQLLWDQHYGGDSLDFIAGVAEKTGVGYVCAGSTRSFGDVLQAWVVGIGPDGAQLWEQHFGSVADTRMERIVARTDGGFALVGYNSAFNAGGKDMFLILTDALGGFQLGKNYGGSNDEVGHAVRLTQDGGYIMCGTTDTYGPGVLACYVVRAGADGETEDDTVHEVFDPLGIEEVRSGRLPLHPNPSTGSLHIPACASAGRWSLTDASGRVHTDQPYAIGTTRLDAEVPSGAYVLRLVGNDGAVAIARVTIIRP